MNKYSIAYLACTLLPTGTMAMGKDDPIVSKFHIEKLEVREDQGEDPLAWDANFYAGKDLQKFWIKTEGEKIGGVTEDAEIRFLFSQAFLPYWDATIGVRHSTTPESEDTWLDLGIQGIAPYFIDTEVSLFINKDGETGFRIDLERELMITQKWVLLPELEANFYDHNDRETGAGSGLSDIELGVRLLYEVRREFSPYVGVHWEKVFGNSADYARDEGGDVSETYIVFGFEAWF